ncbi:unnamed protein product [Amoebophrya sp. A120]|nr:unnamed protein product [Amoebophrya sp. A120]|eukprot:GSA120T00001095001.1
MTMIGRRTHLAACGLYLSRCLSGAPLGVQAAAPAGQARTPFLPRQEPESSAAAAQPQDPVYTPEQLLLIDGTETTLKGFVMQTRAYASATLEDRAAPQEVAAPTVSQIFAVAELHYRFVDQMGENLVRFFEEHRCLKGLVGSFGGTSPEGAAAGLRANAKRMLEYVANLKVLDESMHDLVSAGDVVENRPPAIFLLEEQISESENPHVNPWENVPLASVGKYCKPWWGEFGVAARPSGEQPYICQHLSDIVGEMSNLTLLLRQVFVKMGLGPVDVLGQRGDTTSEQREVGRGSLALSSSSSSRGGGPGRNNSFPEQALTNLLYPPRNEPYGLALLKAVIRDAEAQSGFQWHRWNVNNTTAPGVMKFLEKWLLPANQQCGKFLGKIVPGIPRRRAVLELLPLGRENQSLEFAVRYMELSRLFVFSVGYLTKFPSQFLSPRVFEAAAMVCAASDLGLGARFPGSVQDAAEMDSRSSPAEEDPACRGVHQAAVAVGFIGRGHFGPNEGGSGNHPNSLDSAAIEEIVHSSGGNVDEMVERLNLRATQFLQLMLVGEQEVETGDGPALSKWARTGSVSPNGRFSVSGTGSTPGYTPLTSGPSTGLVSSGST